MLIIICYVVILMRKLELNNPTVTNTQKIQWHNLHKYVKNSILRIDLKRSSKADIDAMT